MPMDRNMIDKSVGEHQYKTLTYVPDENIQQTTQHIARCQENKTPHKLGGLALLFFVSIASDIYRAKNAPEGLPSPPKSAGRPNNNGQCRSRITAAMQHVCQTKGCSPSQTALGFPAHPPRAAITRNSLAELRMKQWHLFSLPGAMGAVIPKVTPITSTPSSPGVEITRLDYTCIEERATLSIAKMIRQIADTLESTVAETINESAVLLKYLTKSPCSNEHDMIALNAITKGIDEIINFIIDKHPSLSLISYLKNRLPAFLRIASDLIDKHHLVIEKFEETSSSLVNLYKMTLHFPPGKSDFSPIIDTAHIPEHFRLKNGLIFIEINHKSWSLVNESEQYYAVRNNVYHRVTYDNVHKVWTFSEDEYAIENTPIHDQFYTRCTVNLNEGNYAHRLCRVITESAHQREGQHSPTDADIPHSSDDEAILKRFDLGLSKQSPDVERLYLSNHWIIYRIRVMERGMQRFLHAIEINGMLIPARARKISVNRFRCEIYNRKQEEKSYCAEFNHGQWSIESSSSIHLSDNLKAVITSGMSENGINSTTLSSPDEQGIKVNRHGDEFIKYKDEFIHLRKENHSYFLAAMDGARLNLAFRFGQFHFINAQVKNGILTLTPKQYQSNYDSRINSEDGLEQPHDLVLNKYWTLLSTNVKANTFESGDAIGSEIEITFRFQCKKTVPDIFHDIPGLVWKSEEKFRDENTYSHTKMDIYKQKDSSYLFNAWNEKYVAAYYYAMSSDKSPKYNQVRIYDNEKNPLYHTEFPITTSEENMRQFVKFYLARAGGLLDITISLHPHVNIVEPLTSLERVIHYNIGFPGVSVLNISHGMVIDRNHPRHVFVSCSDQIALAKSTPFTLKNN